MKPPRGLSAEEAEAWARVAETVKPLVRPRVRKASAVPTPPITQGQASPSAPVDLESALVDARANARSRRSVEPKVSVAVADRKPARPTGGLDSHWDRRFRAGSIDPDFTLDLHGHTLDQAHDRLSSGLTQAKAMGARVVLSPCAWAVPPDHDQVREPYGSLWRRCYGTVARDHGVWIAGASSVGPITDGPWLGHQCIGCSLVVDARGAVVLEGPYGNDADALLLVPVAPEPG